MSSEFFAGAELFSGACGSCSESALVVLVVLARPVIICDARSRNAATATATLIEEPHLEGPRRMRTCTRETTDVLGKNIRPPSFFGPRRRYHENTGRFLACYVENATEEV